MPRIIIALLGLSITFAARAENLPAPFEEFSKEFSTRSGTEWTLDASGGSKILSAPSGSAWDLAPFKALSVKAGLTKNGTAAVRLRWVLESRVGGYYASASSTTLLDGKTEVTAALDPESSDFVPAGHQRPWDKLAAGNVTRIELRAECSFVGKVEDCRVTLSAPDIDSGHRNKATGNRHLFDVALNSPPDSYRAKSLLTFRIEPPPVDPYAADGDGDVRVLLADGREVLAFFDQDFATASDGSAQRDVAVGRPYWRAFLPEVPAPMQIRCGSTTWTVASDFQNAANLPVQHSRTIERVSLPLEVAPTQRVKFSAATPAGYSMDTDGQWKAMLSDPASGVAALWRPIPFWNESWGGFNDSLRPNGSLAQQLDALLSHAAADGKAQPLVILDGECFERDGTFNWDGHPLRKKFAGPGELVRSDAGIDFSRRWIRYCIARWGLSKAVSGLWITEAVNTPGSKEFHDALGVSLKSWTRGIALPVISTNPLACTPKVTTKLGTLVHEEYTADAANYRNKAPLSTFGWKVEVNCKATGTRRENGGISGGPCYELRANDSQTSSIGIVNTLDIPAVQWKSAAADDFSTADTILFDVWVPPESPGDLRIGMHVRNRDNLWYETMLPGMIRPGDWNTYALDITGANSHQLKALGHKKAWTDYSRQRIREFGIDIFSTHPNWKQPLSARFANIRAVRLAPDAPPPAVAITLVPQASLPASGRLEACGTGELWQCHLKLSKSFLNPFDPEQCDLSAIITTPSGKEVRVPAFFDELCERHEKTPGGDEVIEPIGGEFFTVRYRPIEAGPHKVRLELREGGKYVAETHYSVYEKVHFEPGNVTATLSLERPAFVVADRPPGKPFHGFVRTSANKRNLEFDDGTFFYPIGACLRSPSDWLFPYNDDKWTKAVADRVARRATYQYDDYFKSYESAGMTWARVWMCPYWCVLEWRRDWPDYQGTGRYSLINAWRMDHLLTEAEKRGVYISLCLNNHGQYSAQTDSEWNHNPLSTAFGGPVPRAEDFYSNRDAKIAHMNQLRYVVARWGHSPAVMTWSLLSEVEWTAAYKPAQHWNDSPDDPVPVIDAWHADMSNYLKSIDPNKHMVATHFSHPWRGIGTLAIPELDIASSNAYSSMEELHMRAYDASSTLAAYWEGNGSWFHGFKQYNKPALVEEQGRHWDGAMALQQYGIAQTKKQLDADLHAGIWGSMVQPLAGSTGYWWWMHLHFDNRYADYKALANFMIGEDFRAAHDETTLEPVFRQLSSKSGKLLGRALKSDRRMYAWIYHEDTPMGVDVPVIDDGKMRVGGLIPGTYALEFWDTCKGEKISSREIDITAAPVEIELPIVDHDVAMKLKIKK